MNNLEGNHTNCVYCNTESSPTLEEALKYVLNKYQKPSPTLEQDVYCEYWEKNLTDKGGRNPTTGRKLKRGTKTYRDCEWQYNRYKRDRKLSNPEEWQKHCNVLADGRLLETTSNYERARQTCEEITRKAILVKRSKELFDDENVCKLCQKQATVMEDKDEYEKECRACNLGVFGSCGCISYTTYKKDVTCEDCGTRVYYSGESSKLSERNIVSVTGTQTE